MIFTILTTLYSLFLSGVVLYFIRSHAIFKQTITVLDERINELDKFYKRTEKVDIEFNKQNVRNANSIPANIASSLLSGKTFGHD